MTQPEHGCALLFVSGRYQGTVFALPSDGALVLGRDSDVELVLAEDLVSRRHAELVLKGGEAVLKDLGSTNGTFVNGQRIKKVKLAIGDRVLVGSSLMKLVPGAAGAHSTPPVLVTRTRAQAAMQGKIEEIPLPDLVQLIASSRKSGVLLLKHDEEECRIDLREGKLAGCSLSAAPAVADKKAFWRVLAWERGSFELIPPAVPPPLATIDEDVGPMLMEGIRQLDEWREASARIPRMEAKVEVAQPLDVKLRDLSPEELDVLQAAMPGGTIQAILDCAPEPDVDLAKAIGQLLERGYLRVV